MPIFHALVFASFDRTSAQVHRTMQSTLMRQFFADTDFLPARSEADRDADICSWCEASTPERPLILETQGFQVACVDNVLQCIYLRQMPALGIHGSYNIKYTPSTVQKLYVNFCAQSFRIDTRVFPREAVVIDLSSNEIYGCPDLAVLPAHLELLSLHWNRISGPIALLHLPQTLKTLHLHGNSRLKQSVVYYDKVPESLGTVEIDIQLVDYVRPLHGEADERNPSWVAKSYDLL